MSHLYASFVNRILYETSEVSDPIWSPKGDAIYYLAQIKYSNEETINFTLAINDGNEQQTLKFSQKFYVDYYF